MNVLKKYTLHLSAFLLWLFSFHSFYQKQILLGQDARMIYISMNYYLNCLARGVYPMWHPFEAWGRPDDFALRMFGELNPWLYINLLLTSVGVPFSLSFYIYLVTYFLIGMAGFYWLARELLKDRQASDLAFVLFMFSMVGSNLFSDLLTILILVPAIWFIYFLVAFTRLPRRRYVLGMTFCAMILVSTYLPFHFIVAAMAFLSVYVLVFPDRLKVHVTCYARFVLRNKAFMLVCWILLIASAVPGYIWYQTAQSGEEVYSWRPEKNSLVMDIEEINEGGLLGRRSLEDLVSNLDSMNLGSAYVSITVFVLALIGLIAPVNRKLLMLFLSGYMLMLISLGTSTPVYPFLFDRLPFFKFFRNLHFLLWFYVPFFILFAVGLFQQWLKMYEGTKTRRMAWAAYVALIHAGILAVVVQADFVIPSTFWALGLSWILLTALVLGVVSTRSRRFWVSLCVIAVVQPCEVFAHMRGWIAGQRYEYSFDPYTRAESVPQFAFIRPAKGEPHNRKPVEQFGDVVDTDGFVETNFMGTRWAYFLQRKIDHDALKDYVRSKFIAYRATRSFDKEEERRTEIGIYFESLKPFALTAGVAKEISDAPATVILGNSEEFGVEDFEVDRIRFRTDFPTATFVVYNDAYHSGWRATLDGRPLAIERANIAFKGMWIPAGEHVVELSFRQYREWFFWTMLIVMHAIFAVLIVMGIRKEPVSKL